PAPSAADVPSVTANPSVDLHAPVAVSAALPASPTDVAPPGASYAEPDAGSRMDAGTLGRLLDLNADEPGSTVNPQAVRVPQAGLASRPTQAEERRAGRVTADATGQAQRDGRWIDLMSLALTVSLSMLWAIYVPIARSIELTGPSFKRKHSD